MTRGRRWRRALGLGYCVALAAAVLLPVLVVVLGAFVPATRLGMASEQWVVGDEAWLSGKYFVYVLDLYREALVFSALLAVTAVAAGLLLAVPAAYALVRHPFPGSGWLEELALLPLAVPGIAVAVALIQLYSSVRGAWWLLAAGHVLYTAPLLLRTLLHGLRTDGGDGFELERAAATLGARPWQRFRLVTWPRLRRPATLGALMVAAVSWGEFNVSFLLATPLHQPFPAALYATYTSNSFAVSSAATTIFLAVVVPLLVLLEAIGGGDTLADLRQGA